MRKVRDWEARIGELKHLWLRAVYDIAAHDGSGDFFEFVGLPAGATFEEFHARYRVRGRLDYDRLWQDVHRHEPTSAAVRAVLEQHGETPEKISHDVVEALERARQAGDAEGVAALEQLLADYPPGKVTRPH